MSSAAEQDDRDVIDEVPADSVSSDVICIDTEVASDGEAEDADSLTNKNKLLINELLQEPGC